MAQQGKGRVAQVIGAVVDVEFDGPLPDIYNALETTNGGRRPVFSKSRRTSVNRASAPSPWTRRTVSSAVSRSRHGRADLGAGR